MDDLISRQDAIDEIKALYEWHEIVTEDRAIDHFKRLPSAQPEIIRCKDCKHLFDDNKCPLRTWWTHTEEDFCSYAERKTDEADYRKE